MEWLSRVNWVDLLFLIIILRNIYIGSQRGFFSELFNIVGICVSVIIGIQFYSQAAVLLKSYLFVPLNLGELISFVLIYLFIYMLFKVVLEIIRKIMKVQLLPALNKLIDKVGGPLIGFCKGMAVSLFVFLILLLIPVEYVVNSAKINSISGEYLARATEILYSKSIQIMPGVKAVDTRLILKGADPLLIKGLELKRKDKLDENAR